MFKNEYKFIADPQNKTYQKYNILYTLLAPKLMMRTTLVNSKMQLDAYQVIKSLSEAQTPPSSILNPTISENGSLPLRQDLLDLLSRYRPPPMH